MKFAILPGRAVLLGAVLLGAVLLSALPLASRAVAQDLCEPLTRLLTGAPAAFAAGRVAPDGDQRWTAAPVVPHAVCGLWESRQGDADALRCTVNDRTDAASVASFYDANVGVIDRCLAGLPTAGRWNRETKPVAVEGLKGAETVWVHATDALRFSVSLARYQRTVTNTFYDNFVVEYLKY